MSVVRCCLLRQHDAVELLSKWSAIDDQKHFNKVVTVDPEGQYEYGASCLPHRFVSRNSEHTKPINRKNNKITFKILYMLEDYARNGVAWMPDRLNYRRKR